MDKESSKAMKRKLILTAIADEVEMGLWYQTHAAMVDCPETKKLFATLAEDEYTDHVAKLLKMIPECGDDVVSAPRCNRSDSATQNHWTGGCIMDILETAMMLEAQTIAFYGTFNDYKASGLIHICDDCQKMLDGIIKDEKEHLSKLKALYKKAKLKHETAEKIRTLHPISVDDKIA